MIQQCYKTPEVKCGRMLYKPLYNLRFNHGPVLLTKDTSYSDKYLTNPKIDGKQIQKLKRYITWEEYIENKKYVEKKNHYQNK